MIQRKAILCSLLVCLGCVRPAPPNPPASPALVQVVTAVQEALSRAQGQLAGRDLPSLSSAELTLHTKVSWETGGKVNVYVISAGASSSSDNSQEIALTLVPAAPSRSLAPETARLADQLTALITEMAGGIQAAGSGAVPLSTTLATIDVAFVLKSDASAGLSLQAAPLSLEARAGVSREEVQKVKLTFKPKKSRAEVSGSPSS